MSITRKMRLGQSKLKKILTALYILFILPVSKSRTKQHLYIWVSHTNSFGTFTTYQNYFQVVALTTRLERLFSIKFSFSSLILKILTILIWSYSKLITAHVFVRKIFITTQTENKFVQKTSPNSRESLKERRLRSRSLTRHTNVDFTVYMKLVFVQRSIVNRHEPGPRIIVTNVRISSVTR